MRTPKFSIFTIFFLWAVTSFGQQVTIAGYVQDSLSGERLIGATFIESEGKHYTLTNEYGFFSLSLPKGRHYTFEIRFVGYNKVEWPIFLRADTTVLIHLAPATNQLEEVEVKAQRMEIKPTDGSVARLSAQEIKSLPRLLGEADALRAFQLLPGIQGGAEGSSALYVRGGSPDQNLFLLDDVPLYFVNHLGGFLSVIDPNTINAIKLYKGGFPARYGGRLSSVLDIRQKDGNLQKWEKSLSLGLLSSKVFVSGPVKKDKLGIMASFRRSNLDLISRIAALLDSDGKYVAGFYFYDTSVKAHYNISKNDRVSLSFYAGKDRFFLRSELEETEDEETSTAKAEINNHWGNIAVALRWNHTYHEQLFANYTLSLSRFNYLNAFSSRQSQTVEGEEVFSSERISELSSAIQNITLRLHHEWHQKGIWRFGMLAEIPRFKQPGLYSLQDKIDEERSETISGGDRLTTASASLYAERETRLWDKIDVNAGLHGSLFFVEKTIFPSLQPRLVMTHTPAPDWLLKTSYARMVQNLHLLSNSGAGVPTDLWVPATKNVGPAVADLISFGGRWQSEKQNISIELEGYFKWMRGLLDFSQGASFFSGGGDWRSKIESKGIGRAYGLELQLQKKAMRFDGSINYTLSRNFRKFDKLNDGQKFPYKFDRPHSLSIVGIWRPNPEFTMSATWIFESGYAITLPSARYEVEAFDFATGPRPNRLVFGPQSAYLYERRNNYRMPAYHRLDVNFNFKKEAVIRGRLQSRIWSLGIYNLYARQNPYFLFYDLNEENETQLYQFTLFPILPYFSYERNF